MIRADERRDGHNYAPPIRGAYGHVGPGYDVPVVIGPLRLSVVNGGTVRSPNEQ